jgi:hypothetical protein
MLTANGLGHSIVPEYILPAGVTGQQRNMTFKSVVRKKRSDTACMRVSACLLASRDPKFTIKLYNIRNMSKNEIEFPSTHLMNRVKITMTSFSLEISRRFRAASTSVSRFAIIFHKANHLRLMDYNIIGDLPETDPTLFS